MNPEKLLVLEGTVSSDKEYEKREQIMRLISIHKMEEFAKIMDDMVDTDEIERIPFIQRVPIGLYSFSILISANGEEEWSKNCDVIVYDVLQESYERFINDLEQIFKEKGLEDKEKFDDYELEYLCKFIKKNYFQEHSQVIHSKNQDIKDIILYFAQTGVKPEFLAFEDRKSYDLAKVARHIWDEDMGIRKQGAYVDELWEDEKSFWRVFFGHNKKYFLNQIDKELQKIKNPELFDDKAKGVEVIGETISENQLTLHQLKEVNYNAWEKLVKQVYEGAQDEEGYYHSAISDFKSKHRRDFQIDHIQPMADGGRTEIENLQLLTTWENRKKGTKSNTEEINEPNEKKQQKNATKSPKEDVLNQIATERDKGNFIKAIEASDKGIKDFPNDWNFHSKKASLLVETNKHQEALEYYDKALKLDENNGDLYFNKGEALDRLKNIEEALECYEKAAEINPKDVQALYYIGDVLLEMQKPKEAMTYFDKAIKIDPEYSNAYLGKGTAKFYNRRYQDALDNFKKAIQFDDKNYIAYLNKGIVENVKKDYEEALTSLAKAENLFKNDARIFNEKGNSLLGIKKYNEAIKEYEKALQLASESRDIYFNIAFVKDKQSKYSEAVTYYKEVIELDPNHVTAYNNLGYTCYKARKYDDALKYYDEALRIDPSYSYALKNKKDLINKLKNK
ncbi:MAG: tetratricopeptide repeat protein [Clostridiaceae bacterium]|nr:tetratricopeptide repeat protein [Clostridiaceae bacterium]